MSKKAKATEEIKAPAKGSKSKDDQPKKHKADKEAKATPTAPTEAEAVEEAQTTPEIAFESLPVKEHDARKAYETHLAASQSVPVNKATAPIFSVSDAIFLGLLLAKHVEADKKRIKKLAESGEVDYGRIEQLYTLALALWYAETLWQNARKKTSKTPKKQVSQKAQELRAELLAAADYLWRNDPDVKKALKKIREGSGLRDLADDLQRLVSLFLENWAEIEGRSDITPDDLEMAAQQALEVMDVVLADDQKEAFLLRNRLFVLFDQAYKEACDVGRFLYRNEPTEAAERYPRLHVVKSAKSKKPSPTTPQPPSDTPTPS